MRLEPGKRRRAVVGRSVEALEERLVLSGAEPAPASHAPAEVQAAAHPEARAVGPTVNRWSWFAGTYWYVPTRNLPAVLFDSGTGTVAPVSDQTVFQITGYRDGYFWGNTAVGLGSSTPSALSLVGSVTPQGDVLLTFTSTGGSAGPVITQGQGVMRRKCGGWTMENQMFTAPGQRLQIGHWAYMVQTRPGLPSWSALPGAGVSVPQFLAGAGDAAPQPAV
jgi:hypothetical protein